MRFAPSIFKSAPVVLVRRIITASRRNQGFLVAGAVACNTFPPFVPLFEGLLVASGGTPTGRTNQAAVARAGVGRRAAASKPVETLTEPAMAATTEGVTWRSVPPVRFGFPTGTAPALCLSRREKKNMETILIVLVVLILLGGGGFYWRGRRRS